MDLERHYRVFFLSVALAFFCLLVIGIGLRMLLQRFISNIVSKAAHKQLLMDHESMQKGLPLKALNTSPSTSNKTLITAMTATRI